MESGIGSPKDNVEAYMWFTVAGKRGDAYAISEQKLVGALLDPAQKEKAETEASTELQRESGGQP